MLITSISGKNLKRRQFLERTSAPSPKPKKELISIKLAKYATNRTDEGTQRISISSRKSAKKDNPISCSLGSISNIPAFLSEFVAVITLFFKFRSNRSSGLDDFGRFRSFPDTRDLYRPLGSLYSLVESGNMPRYQRSWVLNNSFSNRYVKAPLYASSDASIGNIGSIKGRRVQ